MPVGKWKGTPFYKIPPASLKALIDFWGSPEREHEPQRGLILRALGDEWLRRANKRKRKADRKRRASGQGGPTKT